MREDDVLTRVRARRERHRRRPLAVRVLAAVAGAVLAAAGALLLILAPEAGLPLLAAGLGLLALEFDGAARALAWTLRHTARARAWYARQRPAVKALLWALSAAIVAGIVWWLLEWR